MKLIIKLAATLLISLVIAVLSVRAVVNRPSKGVRNGPWHTDLRTGSTDAGLGHRARIAAHGLWALAPSEVIYYFAVTDSHGAPLEAGATYRVVGEDPDTRWWSVTVYRDDHFIPNPLDRYSYSTTTVAREADGSWQIWLQREPRAGNWLPTGEGPGPLALTLRCYDPGPRLSADPGAVPLPRILRETSS